MAQALVNPLPPANFAWVDRDGKPTQAFYTFMQKHAASIFGTLIAVAVPNNANAAAAGVPLGGLYSGTADPAIVYVRTA
jgi:hypothetical protein